MSVAKRGSPPQDIRSEHLGLFRRWTVVMRNNHLASPVKLGRSRIASGSSVPTWSDRLLVWTDSGSRPIRFEGKYRQRTYSGNPEDFDWTPDPIFVSLRRTGDKGRISLRFWCFLGDCGDFIVTGLDGRVLSPEGDSFEWAPHEPGQSLLTIRAAGKGETFTAALPSRKSLPCGRVDLHPLSPIFTLPWHNWG